MDIKVAKAKEKPKELGDRKMMYFDVQSSYRTASHMIALNMH